MSAEKRLPDRTTPRCPSCGQLLRYKDQRRTHRGWIYAEKVLPTVEVILKQMPLHVAAAEMGMSRSGLSLLRNGHNTYVRKETALKIFALLKSLSNASSDLDKPAAVDSEPDGKLFIPARRSSTPGSRSRSRRILREYDQLDQKPEKSG